MAPRRWWEEIPSLGLAAGLDLSLTLIASIPPHTACKYSGQVPALWSTLKDSRAPGGIKRPSLGLPQTLGLPSTEKSLSLWVSEMSPQSSPAFGTKWSANIRSQVLELLVKGRFHVA